MEKGFSAEYHRMVLEEVRAYCRRKGYREGKGINNFVPHNCATAFQMAKVLIERKLFDICIAIAPEGHIYSFFLELLGSEVLSVFVDYPPTQVKVIDDLSSVKGKRVLLIEDDVVSGATLRLVLDTLAPYAAKSVSLYLGHAKSIQHLQNVPGGITKIYLAEDYLIPALSRQYTSDFETYWKSRKPRTIGSNQEGIR